MRNQCRITTWKDDQGFGFVTPNGGGERVFLHIKSFSNHRRRPAGNELVTYELAADERGRPRAVRVAFVGERPVEPPNPRARWFSAAFGLVFLGLVAVTVAAGKLPPIVLGVYVIASAVTFIAYALDKSAARHERWRTQESTLHLFGLIGGWPGALVAQKMLRHKSRKQEFQVVFWATVVLNCAALAIFARAAPGLP